MKCRRRGDKEMRQEKREKTENEKKDKDRKLYFSILSTVNIKSNNIDWESLIRIQILGSCVC